MAADYRHIGGLENRLGRHYSRFSPFSPTAPLADQSLALRKLWNAGSNRRSQARGARLVPNEVGLPWGSGMLVDLARSDRAQAKPSTVR